MDGLHRALYKVVCIVTLSVLGPQSGLLSLVSEGICPWVSAQGNQNQYHLPFLTCVPCHQTKHMHPRFPPLVLSSRPLAPVHWAAWWICTCSGQETCASPGPPRALSFWTGAALLVLDCLISAAASWQVPPRDSVLASVLLQGPPASASERALPHCCPFSLAVIPVPLGQIAQHFVGLHENDS